MTGRVRLSRRVVIEQTDDDDDGCDVFGLLRLELATEGARWNDPPCENEMRDVRNYNDAMEHLEKVYSALGPLSFHYLTAEQVYQLVRRLELSLKAARKKLKELA